MDTKEPVQLYKTIPPNEVVIMAREYRDYAKRHKEYDPNKHVKAVWFDVEKIHQMCEDLIKEGADGVRIYFGRYPENVSQFEKPLPKPGYNSVVFVSTMKINGVPKTDYYTHKLIDPLNRGEHCQPECEGADVDDKP